MWLVNFLPEWIFHIVLLAGVVGLIAAFILSFIPLIGRYSLPIKVISACLVVGGLFIEGAIYNNYAWQQKVVEAERRAKEAEIKAAKANAKIQYRTIEKIQIVKDIKQTTQNKIQQHSTSMDAQCVITPEAIEVLNEQPKARKKKQK